MLTIKYSHEQYQSFAHGMLTKFFIDFGQQITFLTNFPYISKLWNADLIGFVPLIRVYYSCSTQDAPPKDAVALLRSLILMSFKGEARISSWVDTLRSDPFFAILSGFLPGCLGSSRIEGIPADPIPGVGTFYNFIDRLIRQDRILYRSKLRKRRRKSKSKQKKNRKMDSPSTTLTERLFNSKFSNSKLPDSIEASLNKILKELFVLPSLNMGLLGGSLIILILPVMVRACPLMLPISARKSVSVNLSPVCNATVNVNSPILLPHGAGIVITKNTSTDILFIRLLLPTAFTVCLSISNALPVNVMIR
ncbi:MAG: hypothetical protein PWQ60_1384 [Thermoanaerobacteraceae bacterium]|nr:hypothetical protein [Thermoanaerobacteraceae bacterium]